MDTSRIEVKAPTWDAASEHLLHVRHQLQRELAVLEHDPQPLLGGPIQSFYRYGLLPFS